MEKLTECGHSCPQKPTECGFSNPPADKNSPEGAHMVRTPFNRGSENPHSGFFSPYTDIDMRKRYHLPHWQQGQVWCFVTWRLADSIPAETLRQWTEEKQHWLRLHPEPWDEATTEEYHQRFTHHIEKWLDKGVGSCLLKDTENAQIVSNALLHFNGERYDLATFVVMPNHVHVLFRPYEGHTIADILKSWKGFTAREINKRMKTQGTLWQAEFWDRLVRNEPHFHTYALYIRDNPEKAGLKDGFLLWQECGTECGLYAPLQGNSCPQKPTKTRTECGHSCPPEAQCGQECPHSVPIPDGIKTEEEKRSKERLGNNPAEKPSPTNDTLYHYCNIDSVMKIIRSKCLWLTNCRSSNDSMEMGWTLNVLRQVVYEMITNSKNVISKEQMLETFNKQINEFSSMENRGSVFPSFLSWCKENVSSMPSEIINSNTCLAVVEDLFDHLCDDLEKNVFRTYITCFSMARDHLGQWRGYGDDGRGIAIGFNKDILSKLEIHNVYLRQAIYHANIQMSCITESIAKYVMDQKTIRSWVYNILPVFKHPAFEEEREWRLVFVPDENANLKMSYYFKQNQLRICYEIPIVDNFITEIVLGPKCMITPEDLICFFRLSGFNITSEQIIKSNLPYV